MSETEIRERLKDLAADAPQGFTAPPSLLRRTRRRVVLTLAAFAMVALAIVFGGIAGGRWLGASDRQPAVPPPPALPEIRRGGEILVLKWGTGPPDLAAQDPQTGEVRKVVETDGIVVCTPLDQRLRCRSFVKSAEWSSDGRWVAFDVSFDSPNMLPHGPCGPTAGVWVKNALGDPRQLTTPCDTPPPGAPESDIQIDEIWAWSPVGARLAYARIDGATDELFVVDPADGRRTSLGTADGQLTALAWSPDGTRIAYADGGSIYEIAVEGGEPMLLAESFVDVEAIAWSPDGTQVLVQGGSMQVMNADGSDLHSLGEGEKMAWSPDGERILYQSSTNDCGSPSGEWCSEVWTVSPDGSNRIMLYQSGCSIDTLPVWAPNGTQVAYHACGAWVVSNADGTGERRPINQLVYRSWRGGGWRRCVSYVTAC